MLGQFMSITTRPINQVSKKDHNLHRRDLAATSGALALVEGTGLEHVRATMRALGPVASELGVGKPDLLLAGTQWTYLHAWREVAERVSEGERLGGQEWQKYATALAICTDKILLLTGRPTAILAGVHEVRHSLPELAERLSKVRSVVQSHRQGAIPASYVGMGTADGYDAAPSVADPGPVSDCHKPESGA